MANNNQGQEANTIYIQSTTNQDLNQALNQNQILKSQIFKLQQALLAANNSRNSAINQLDQYKNQYSLLDVANDKARQISKNEQILANALDKIKNLLEIERNKNLKLVNENDSLKQSLRAYQSSKFNLSEQKSDSGLSDNNSDSEHTNRSKKKSENSKTTPSTSTLIKSLAREKLKCASLAEQNENLQSMINTKNLVSQKLLEKENDIITKLKDKVEKYENRITTSMQNYTDTLDKLDVVLLQNEQLQAELDTIGEYIIMYRQQRSALKQMQYQENQKNVEILEEKMEMKAKLEYLVLLVKQLLADRTMAHEDLPGLNQTEIVTTEKILEVVEDVRVSQGLDCEPIQIKMQYYGPQWDI